MAVPYQLVVSITDGDDISTTSLHVPTGFTLAQYIEFAQSFGGLVDDIILGAINGADLCVGVDIGGITPNVADVESDREEYASFKFQTAEGRDTIVNIPTVSDEKTVNNLGDEIDQADAEVAAFITAMQTGIAVTGGTISPCDVGEDDIVTLLWGRERFRNSGKRR